MIGEDGCRSVGRVTDYQQLTSMQLFRVGHAGNDSFMHNVQSHVLVERFCIPSFHSCTKACFSGIAW